MPYNEKLAERLRETLAHLPKVKEKRMFSGIAFMVNDKMCVNVSGDDLMCRFDPALYDELCERNGFRPMIMRGKQLNGYCYVSGDAIKSKKEFDFWVNLCLDYNKTAKSSKKKPKKKIPAGKKR
jgi:TfoX/Sxy family transcriptional regulator of competence genes